VTVDLAAAAGDGIVGGRAATVVTGGDVTGTVAGVAAITGVVTAAAGVVLTMGVVGAGVLTGGKAPVAAGGMSYFCI